MRYYFLWFELLLVHWYIFFKMTDETKLCMGVPYCNRFEDNGWLITMYIMFCIYFTLSASQIRLGLPELKRGGFLLGNYDVVSKLIFETWYYIPFLFELRTIIDWTFNTTTLDVF